MRPAATDVEFLGRVPSRTVRAELGRQVLPAAAWVSPLKIARHGRHGVLTGVTGTKASDLQFSMELGVFDGGYRGAPVTSTDWMGLVPPPRRVTPCRVEVVWQLMSCSIGFALQGP